MAVTKTILQNVRQQSVVKLINNSGTATSNITLLELKMSDETFDQPNTAVNIQSVLYSATDSTAAPVIVSRGSDSYVATPVMYLHGSGSLNLTEEYGFHDNSSNSSNISVSMPAQSVVYLVLGKSGGYIEPDQQTKR